MEQKRILELSMFLPHALQVPAAVAHHRIEFLWVANKHTPLSNGATSKAPLPVPRLRLYRTIRGPRRGTNPGDARAVLRKEALGFVSRLKAQRGMGFPAGRARVVQSRKSSATRCRCRPGTSRA